MNFSKPQGQFSQFMMHLLWIKPSHSLKMGHLLMGKTQNWLLVLCSVRLCQPFQNVFFFVRFLSSAIALSLIGTIITTSFFRWDEVPAFRWHIIALLMKNHVSSFVFWRKCLGTRDAPCSSHGHCRLINKKIPVYVMRTWPSDALLKTKLHGLNMSLISFIYLSVKSENDSIGTLHTTFSHPCLIPGGSTFDEVSFIFLSTFLIPVKINTTGLTIEFRGVAPAIAHMTSSNGYLERNITVT